MSPFVALPPEHVVPAEVRPDRQVSPHAPESWTTLQTTLLDEMDACIASFGVEAPTAVHVFNEARIEDRIDAWRDIPDCPTAWHDLSEYHAPELVEILANKGVSFCACSAAHLKMLHNVRDRNGASITGDRIRLVSPFNDEATLEAAAEMRIGSIAIASLDNLESLLAIRANLKDPPPWNPKIDLRIAIQKDGDPHLTVDSIEELAKVLTKSGLTKVGLSIDLRHLDYANTRVYSAATEILTEAYTRAELRGLDVSEIYLGNGFCSERLAHKANPMMTATAQVEDVVTAVRNVLIRNGIRSGIELAGDISRFAMGDKALAAEVLGTGPEKVHVGVSGYGAVNRDQYWGHNADVVFRGDPKAPKRFMRVEFRSCDSSDCSRTRHLIGQDIKPGDHVILFTDGGEHTDNVAFNGNYCGDVVIKRRDGRFERSYLNNIPLDEQAHEVEWLRKNQGALESLFEAIRRKVESDPRVPEADAENELYARDLLAVAAQYPGWDAQTVHNLHAIAANAHDMSTKVGVPKSDFKFAFKASPSLYVTMMLRYLGYGCDTASKRERDLARLVGYSLDSEVNSNPHRDSATLKSIAEPGQAPDMVTVDSRQEIDRLLAAGVDPATIGLGFRLAITTEQKVGNLNEKFGTTVDEACALIQYAIDKGFDRKRLYLAGHPGTQKTSAADYAKLKVVFLQVTERFFNHPDTAYRFLIGRFDYGGGFPSQIVAKKSGKSLGDIYSEVGNVVAECDAAYCKMFGASPKTLRQMFEPGRTIVQGAKVGIRVLATKTEGGRKVVVLNTSVKGQIVGGRHHDGKGYEVKALGFSVETEFGPAYIHGYCGPTDSIPALAAQFNERAVDRPHLLPDGIKRGDIVMIDGGDYASGASGNPFGRGLAPDAFMLQKRGDPAAKVRRQPIMNDMRYRVGAFAEYFADRTSSMPPRDEFAQVAI